MATTSSSPDRSAIRFLVNPGGGRGRAAPYVDRIQELAREMGAEVLSSKSAEDLTRQAEKAVRDGVRRLVVAGGDGSMNLAVQGLAGSDCALAILPLGSGNDLAGSFGVPSELEAAVHFAASGPISRVDLGRVAGKYYAGIAGVGFDSETNEFANRVRRLSGSAVYLYAVLRTLIGFEAPHLEVRWEGGHFEGEAMLGLLANTPRFGGGMQVAPEAEADDGQLDLVIVRRLPKLKSLALFARVYGGNHVHHPAVTVVRTRWAEFKLDRPMAVYGDGERLAEDRGREFRFEIVPRALAVVRSPDSSR